MLTGNDLKTFIMTILGNLFAAVLAVRTFGHWAKSEWGKFVTTLLGAAIVAFCVWAPDKAVTVLKFVGEKLTG
ncbi:TcpD family membrane protein [Streptomyces sp. MS1.AVA.3]|uniref:TcpD family membrane protein n=1 Tax=Streptomyces decoyicus TaxID=249567 RepID=UPI0030C01A7B